MIECKEEHAIEIAKRGQQILYSQIGDMPLPVDIGIGHNYRDLTEYVQCPRCGGKGCGGCTGNGILPEKAAAKLQV